MMVMMYMLYLYTVYTLQNKKFRIEYREAIILITKRCHLKNYATNFGNTTESISSLLSTHFFSIYPC